MARFIHLESLTPSAWIRPNQRQRMDSSWRGGNLNGRKLIAAQAVRDKGYDRVVQQASDCIERIQKARAK